LAELRLVVADEKRTFSSIWGVKSFNNTPELVAFVRVTGGFWKLVLHAPRPGLPNYVVHVRVRQDQNAAYRTRFRDVAFAPIDGLIRVAAICVLPAQPRSIDVKTLPQKTLVGPPPADGMQANFVIYVDHNNTLAAGHWPGRNRGTQLVWSAKLTDGSTAYVVRSDEPAVPLTFPKQMVTTDFVR
jgi:hypothetical protein